MTDAARVHLLAYACEPGRGSEPGVGMLFLRRLLRLGYRVVLYTRPHRADAIRSVLTPQESARLAIVSIASPRALLPLRRKGRAQLLDYAIWQVRAWRRLRRGREGREVVHHVTYANDWFPVAALLVGSPTIWGPVGGSAARHALAWFLPYLPPREALSESVRLGTSTLLRQVCRVLVRRQRTVVVANNDDTARAFGSSDVHVEPNVMVRTTDGSVGQGRQLRTGAVRMIAVGRLVGWKGGLLALEVLSRLPPTATLEFYGQGRLRPALERRAVKLGLRDRVTFHGNVDYPSLVSAYRSATCLLQLSLYDGSPFSVAEALTFGCPVVTTGSGGAAGMVRRSAGGHVVEMGPRLAERCTQAVLATVDMQVGVHDPFPESRLDASIREWYADAMRRAGLI